MKAWRRKRRKWKPSKKAGSESENISEKVYEKLSMAMTKMKKATK
jgi:hypothetical protein